MCGSFYGCVKFGIKNPECRLNKLLKKYKRPTCVCDSTYASVLFLTSHRGKIKGGDTIHRFERTDMGSTRRSSMLNEQLWRMGLRNVVVASTIKRIHETTAGIRFGISSIGLVVVYILLS